MHVCEAMLFASEQGERLLHHDISYGNIVHISGAASSSGYVAADGWLPWKRTAHRGMDALKRWHMTVPECVADWTQRCTGQLRPIIEQLRCILFSSSDAPAASVAFEPAPAQQRQRS